MFTQWQRKQHLCQKMIYILVQILTTVWAVNSQPLQQQVLAEVPNVSGTNLRNSGYEYQYEEAWPKLSRKLGSVSAVAFDIRGNAVVFHRGSHVWDITSFDQKNRYKPIEAGPIDESTLLSFDTESGDLLHEWGANFFYMPHGLTIDKSNNFWLTDVALHQVFKFNLSVSSSEPVLTLGTRFEPGTGSSSFCKPTSVAVLDNGDFFVADGYCNGRIMKFSSDGQLILSWGKNSFALTRTFTLPPGPVPENFFAIPHALTYLEDRQLICVADREQGRIQCFHAQNGTFHSMYSNAQIGGRLFSIKYLPLDGGLFFMINGPQFPTTLKPVSGLIMSMNNSEIVGRFYPDTNTQHDFENPHELAISADGGQIYVAELKPTKVHKFKRKGRQVPKVIKSLEHYRFPPSPPMVADTLYASSLTIVSFVASLLGTSCLILCVSRTMCFKSGGGTGRRSRFSTGSENVALHRMGREDDEERGEVR